MTEDKAHNTLEDFIKKMKAPDSNISYAAIVADPLDVENFIIEYGTYDAGGGFYFETELNDQQTEDFKNELFLEYGLKENTKDFRSVVTNSSEGKLLNHHPLKEKIRPLKAGISVSDLRSIMKSGTLGILFSVQENTKTYLLSNMHVLAYYKEEAGSSLNPKKEQEEIVQPSRSDSANINYENSPFIIGKTVWKRFDGIIDAAVAVLYNDVVSLGGFFNAEIELNPFIYTRLKLNRTVIKYGRTTGLTDGKLISVNAAIRLENPYPTVNREGKYMVFTDQIMTSNMADPGDSGSLLIDEQRKQGIGLTFADINFNDKALLSHKIRNFDPPGRTFHNKLQNIITALEKGDNYDGNSHPLHFNQFI